MKTVIFAWLVASAGVVIAQPAPAAASVKDRLGPQLEASYNRWRAAMVGRDARAWQAATAPHRVMEIRNRIVSEKQPYPAAVFQVPAPPPVIRGMKLLDAAMAGPTAKAAWFGKLDFGRGPEGGDNLLVVSFSAGSSGWLYDRADVVNLAALPEVRKELAAGNLKYLRETPEAKPSGHLPPTPAAVGTPKAIAKVYVFCPGREVKVRVNKISAHRFANTKEAEVVIGGARDGINEVSYSVKKLEGGTGKEALAIRVYVFSELQGVKPVKAYEYVVREGGAVKPYGNGSFTLDAAMLQKLMGK